MNTEPANRGLEVVIEGGHVTSRTFEVPASVLRCINGLVERGLDPSIADNLRQFIEHGQVGEQIVLTWIGTDPIHGHAEPGSVN